MGHDSDEAREAVAPFSEVIAEVKEAGGAAFRLCYQCGKCDVVCPWNRVRPFSMRRLIREASLGLPEIEAEELWRCTTCGTCPTACPRGVAQIDISVSLRRIAHTYDVFPAAVRGARTAAGSVSTDGNPLGEDRASRADWTRGLPSGVEVPEFEEGMEVLWFVGCYYAHDPRMRKVALATASLLHRAGVSFGTLGAEESCCGESIRKTGAEDVFRAVARRNITTFINRGVRRILVASPHCYHTFKREYPEFMVAFDVVHLSEFLRDLIANGRLVVNPRGGAATRVTYHDPCYLGRHGGIYDAPREVLGAVPGLELAELPDAREGSLCCGGGGGRIWMDTPREERFSDLRVRQAMDIGARVLATSCPYCISNFEESRLSLDCEEAIAVKDITEILAEACQPGEGSRP